MWMFRGGAGFQELPDVVKCALVSRFHLDSQTISRLRCLERAGWHCGRPVRCIKVLDSAILPRERSSAITRYDDVLRQEKGLAFEGHIERDGSVYLADRRPPRPFARPASRSDL